MADPANSGAARGVSAVVGVGASPVVIVVMLMTPPRAPREWAVGLISTVVSSIGDGAVAIEHFGLHQWAGSPIGLCAMVGLIFASGLPGWALVRWVFNFIDRNRSAGIDEAARDVKKILWGRHDPAAAVPGMRHWRHNAGSLGDAGCPSVPGRHQPAKTGHMNTIERHKLADRQAPPRPLWCLLESHGTQARSDALVDARLDGDQTGRQ